METSLHSARARFRLIVPLRRLAFATFALPMLAAQIGSPAAPARADDAELSTLIAVLKDTSKGTSEKGDACLKLMDMGARAKPAVPALTNLLRDSDKDMRDYAITTLKKIGPGASSALSTLHRLAANDPSEEIRSLAADAVASISGGGADAGKDDDQPAAPKPADPAPHAKPMAPPLSGAIGSSGPAKRDISLMATVYPELTRLPAPSWVKPGVRLCYYVASATIAGKGPIFQLDPQGPIFATDGSGRRYSAKPGSREEGMGGHGYGDYTIVSVDPNNVAVAADVYSMAGGNPSPRQMKTAAFVGAPGCTADLWVNPGWLKHLRTGMSKDLRILRMPFKLGTTSRPAIAFATPSNDMVLLYDESTGVLLYRGGSGEGEKGLNLRINGQYVPNEPSRMLTLSSLVSQRTPQLPWTNQAPPAWAAKVRTVRYEGRIGAVIPGSPNIPLPTSLTLQLVARGSNWARFRASSVSGGVGGGVPIRDESEWMAGLNQLGGLWISPGALAELRTGQEVDRDSVIGFVTTVGQSMRGPSGREMVTFVHQGQVQRTTVGYDKQTGMLVYLDREDRGLAGTMRATLALRGVE